MSHGHVDRCPNCTRMLTPSEIYCYFCELDISELKKKQQKSMGGYQGHGH